MTTAPQWRLWVQICYIYHLFHLVHLDLDVRHLAKIQSRVRFKIKNTNICLIKIKKMQFVFPHSSTLPYYCYLSIIFSPLLSLLPTTTPPPPQPSPYAVRRCHHCPLFLSSSSRCHHHRQTHRRRHILLVK